MARKSRKSWRSRATEPEILDEQGLGYTELKANMTELAQVNHWLGGYRILRKVLSRLEPHLPKGRPPRLADMGCGSGDSLRMIQKWRPHWQLSGYDLSPLVSQLARECSRDFPAIHYHTTDLRDLPQPFEHDVLCFNLVLHHLSDADIVRTLQRYQRAGRFVIINDLQRHWLPFALFGIFSRLLNLSYISRHDGLLSIRKSFTRRHWQQLLAQAGVTQYQIQWYWAFRWVVTIDNSPKNSK